MQLSARGSLAIGITALFFCAVACDPDVDYLRAGPSHSGGGGGGGKSGAGGSSVAGNGGSDVSNGGSGGSDQPDGGGGDSTTGGTGGDSGGNGGSGGSGGGYTPDPNCIQGQARLTENFPFDNGAAILNVSDGRAILWQKGPYDTTDTNTGYKDTTAVPPSNPKNLANLSKIEFLGGDGNPAGSMKLSVPFSGSNVHNISFDTYEPEHMHVIYVWAVSGSTKDVVNVTARTLTTDVKVLNNPRPDCKLTINAWTTGTNMAAASFMHVDGPITDLTTSTDWQQVTMDLDSSNKPGAVNQYGFAVDSSCTNTTPIKDGAQTVILFDNIAVACKPAP